MNRSHGISIFFFLPGVLNFSSFLSSLHFHCQTCLRNIKILYFCYFYCHYFCVHLHNADIILLMPTHSSAHLSKCTKRPDGFTVKDVVQYVNGLHSSEKHLTHNQHTANAAHSAHTANIPPCESQSKPPYTRL